MLFALLLAAASEPRVAVVVTGAPGDRAAAAEERLLQAMGPGIRFATAQELAAAQQAKGSECNDDGACLAQLCAGLGVEHLVLGNVAGGTASFKLVATKTGEVLAAWSATETPAFVDEPAAKLRVMLVGEGPRQPSVFRWLPMAMGAVVLACSIGLYAYAYSEHRRLVNGDPSINSDALADALASRGKSIETTSFLLGGLGLVLLAGGALFALAAPESDVRVGAAWVNGPVIGFSGALP